MSWSSSRRSREYRLVMTVAVGLCAAGAAGSVLPGLDTAVGAVFLAVAVTTLVVAIARRELRIRRRIADTGGTIRPAPRSPAAARTPRVGPGDGAPVSPAPTRMRVVRGREHPAAATPASSPGAADRRPATPTGGAA